MTVGAELFLSSDLHQQLTAHLTGSEDEEVAFLAARLGGDSGGVLEAFDLYTVPPHGFAVQTDFHIRLTDEARGSAIRWAHDRDAALVEAHAHLGPWPASFSASDLSGLAEWVPHVRWRLRSRPYVALVFGTASFDALAWISQATTPEPMAIRVGRRLLSPTGLTHVSLVRDSRRRRE